MFLRNIFRHPLSHIYRVFLVEGIKYCTYIFVKNYIYILCVIKFVYDYSFIFGNQFSGLQAFEIMAIAAVGNNLITYVINEMHFSLSKSANVVTNFIGTVFLLALLGGYLSDSYLGSFWTILIFGFVELSVSYLWLLFISLSLSN